MEQNKFYYYDEDNDLLEYIEGNGNTFAKYVNPHLTLIFSEGCTDMQPENIIGFQLSGSKQIIQKSKRNINFTSEETERLVNLLKGWGAILKTDENGNYVINLNEDNKEKE